MSTRHLFKLCIFGLRIWKDVVFFQSNIQVGVMIYTWGALLQQNPDESKSFPPLNELVRILWRCLIMLLPESPMRNILLKMHFQPCIPQWGPSIILSQHELSFSFICSNLHLFCFIVASIKRRRNLSQLSFFQTKQASWQKEWMTKVCWFTSKSFPFYWRKEEFRQQNQCCLWWGNMQKNNKSSSYVWSVEEYCCPFENNWMEKKENGWQSILMHFSFPFWCIFPSFCGEIFGGKFNKPSPLIPADSF